MDSTIPLLMSTEILHFPMVRPIAFPEARRGYTASRPLVVRLWHPVCAGLVSDSIRDTRGVTQPPNLRLWDYGTRSVVFWSMLVPVAHRGIHSLPTFGRETMAPGL